MAPLSLREVATRMDNLAPELGVSARELALRIRWEDGWQGSGPLSAMSLLRTLDSKSLREACGKIDAATPPTSVRDGFSRLGHPVGGGVTRLPPRAVSVREIRDRVSVPPIRLLTYNTYLLVAFEIPLRKWIDRTLGWRALQVFGIPQTLALLAPFGLTAVAAIAVTEILDAAGVTPSDVIEKTVGVKIPPIRIEPKPAREERTRALGPVLEHYDVCCLSEVFKPESARVISEGAGQGWTTVEGSTDNEGELQMLGSGLYFMAKRYPVTRSDRTIYKNGGDRLRDTDAWSNKGALFNALDIGFGELEVFQTHLYFGGRMPVSLGAIREPTEDERMDVWRHQLDELLEFVRRNHRPENVAIITGDFNMDGVNVRHYAELRRKMDAFGFQDAWAWDAYRHRPSEGQTSRFTDDKPFQREFDGICVQKEESDGAGDTVDVRARAYCEDTTTGDYQKKQRAGVGRYDFIWIERPTGEHQYHLELSRIMRRPFPLNQIIDGERHLSDHMGLEVELYPSSR